GMGPSVAFGDETPLPDGGLIVVGALLLASRQLDLLVRQLLVRDLRQDVRDRVQPRGALVVRAENVPRREVRVGLLEHAIPRLRVIVPALQRGQIHRAQLPLPEGIFNAPLEPATLLVWAHLEPELDEGDAPLDDEVLDLGAVLQEALILLVR